MFRWLWEVALWFYWRYLKQEGDATTSIIAVGVFIFYILVVLVLGGLVIWGVIAYFFWASTLS